MIRNRGEHEIELLVNGNLVSASLDVRDRFRNQLPNSSIHAFFPLDGLDSLGGASNWRVESSELLREAVIADLAPDVVLLASLFEGFRGDAVTSIHKYEHRIPVATVLYDLIPLIHSEVYLRDPLMKTWYGSKLTHARRADLAAHHFGTQQEETPSLTCNWIRRSLSTSRAQSIRPSLRPCPTIRPRRHYAPSMGFGAPT